MKLIFAVKDTATDSFGPPLFFNSKGEAMRSFTDEANSESAQSAIAKHPEDYIMYEIGAYDDTDGSITGTNPEQLARAKDLVMPRN